MFETTNVPLPGFNEALALIADIPLGICPERRRVIHHSFEIKQNKKSRYQVEQPLQFGLSFVFRKLTTFSGNTPVSEEIRVLAEISIILAEIRLLKGKGRFELKIVISSRNQQIIAAKDIS